MVEPSLPSTPLPPPHTLGSALLSGSIRSVHHSRISPFLSEPPPAPVAPGERHPGPPHAWSLGRAWPAPRLPLRVAMVPRGPGAPQPGPLCAPPRSLRGKLTFEVVVGLRLEILCPLQRAIGRGFVLGRLSTLSPLALRHRHAAKRPPPWQQPPAAPSRIVAKECRWPPPLSRSVVKRGPRRRPSRACAGAFCHRERGEQGDQRAPRGRPS